MSKLIVKHWRGQLVLLPACCSVLVALPFALWFVVVGNYLAAHPPTAPLTFVVLLLLPFLAFLPAATWSLVGVWRSAGRRISFLRPIWGWLARGSVVIAALVLALATITVGRTTQAMLLDSEGGADPAYEVSLRGNTAIFHGRIGKAAAGELEMLLRDRSVKRLAIAGSGGGDMQQALRLARLIHERRLFVVALTQCDAACTLLLSAGQGRAVLPDTIIGFGAVAGSAAALRLYRQAGLSVAFLDGLRERNAGRLFEPPLYTLIASGFLNNIFVNASRRYVSARDWCAKNLAACGRSGRQNVDVEKNSGDDGYGN